jgi:hypothetical protein
VVAAGAAVTRFSAGDEVFGFGQGSFAEYAVNVRDDRISSMSSDADERASPWTAAWLESSQRSNYHVTQAVKGVLVVRVQALLATTVIIEDL